MLERIYSPIMSMINYEETSENSHRKIASICCSLIFQIIKQPDHNFSLALRVQVTIIKLKIDISRNKAYLISIAFGEKPRVI